MDGIIADVVVLVTITFPTMVFVLGTSLMELGSPSNLTTTNRDLELKLARRGSR